MDVNSNTDNPVIGLRSFGENPQAVAEKLQQLIEKVFVRKRMLVSFTGEEGSYEKASPIMQKYLEKLPEGTPAQAAIHPVQMVHRLRQIQ